MVISSSEKAILLERLQKARETKAAKAAAKKKETPASVKEPEPEPPAPTPAPAPAPALAPEPIAAPPSVAAVVPEVPDLVAASKKKPKKVQLEEDSDSDSEHELPPKKGRGKKQEKPKYMKIVLYKEPKNQAAFQQLIESVQDEEPEMPPPPPPVAQPPASGSIGRGCKFDIKNATPREGRTLPTPQELMRRAALEFFG